MSSHPCRKQRGKSARERGERSCPHFVSQLSSDRGGTWCGLTKRVTEAPQTLPAGFLHGFGFPWEHSSACSCWEGWVPLLVLAQLWGRCQESSRDPHPGLGSGQPRSLQQFLGSCEVFIVFQSSLCPSSFPCFAGGVRTEMLLEFCSVPL